MADPSQVLKDLPPLMNLTTDNITENVNLINSAANSDARFKYVLERLVAHLHDFARETRLSMKEWMVASCS
jgi:Catechol dioxygenase N terminus